MIGVGVVVVFVGVGFIVVDVIVFKKWKCEWFVFIIFVVIMMFFSIVF